MMMAWSVSARYYFTTHLHHHHHHHRSSKKEEEEGAPPGCIEPHCFLLEIRRERGEEEMGREGGRGQNRGEKEEGEERVSTGRKLFVVLL